MRDHSPATKNAKRNLFCRDSARYKHKIFWYKKKTSLLWTKLFETFLLEFNLKDNWISLFERTLSSQSQCMLFLSHFTHSRDYKSRRLFPDAINTCKHKCHRQIEKPYVYFTVLQFSTHLFRHAYHYT